MPFRLVLILLTFLLTACVPARASAPTWTPSATPTPSTFLQVYLPASPPATATAVPTPLESIPNEPQLPPSSTPTPLPGDHVAPPPGLVYRWEDGLWKIAADGSPQLLLDLEGVERVSLSENGYQALFNRADGIFTAGLARVLPEKPTPEDELLLAPGSQAQLQPEAETGVICPAWWPTRPDIVIGLVVPLQQLDAIQNGCVGQPAAFTNSGEFIKYLAPSRNAYGPLAAAGDGKTIVFDQEGDPWIYRSGIGSKRFTPYSYNFPAYTAASFFYPEFSPSGERLAWLVHANINGVWRTGVGVFQLEEKKSRLLSPYPAWSETGEMSRISWSPGEDQLALFNYASHELWLLEISGKVLYTSRTLSSHHPVWSPTGAWLAYPQYDDALSGFVLDLIPASGDQPLHLASLCTDLPRGECGMVRSLAWRPDGAQLVMAQDLISYDTVNWLVEPDSATLAPIDLPPGAVVMDWFPEPTGSTPTP